MQAGTCGKMVKKDCATPKKTIEMKKEATLSVGAKVNGYRVIGFLKSDAHGVESYRVRDKNNNRAILRLYADDVASVTLEYIHRDLFADELGPFAQVLASGVKTVNKRKYRYVVRSIVLGRPIARCLEAKKKYNWLEVRDITYRILMALKYLHGQKRPIIHNNIKSSSVLIESYDDDFKSVYLLGTSQFSYSGTQNALSDTSIRNLLCRAPEAYDGICNERTDIFMVGSLMIDMLLGMEKPLPDNLGEGEKYKKFFVNYFRTLYNSTMVAFLPLTDAQKSFVLKMVAFKPEDRFQTVDEVLESLIQCGNEVAPNVIEEDDITLPDISDVTDSIALQCTPKRGGLNDVAGMEELKQVLQNNVLYVLQNPDIADKYGLTIPNGMLLYGPPGCGKTFIAEKFAEEADLNFVKVKSSDIGSAYLHETQHKIAELFEEAEENAPTILFFDEFDGIAPRRSGLNCEHISSEVNELLCQLNNCSDRGIFVIVATNYPERIDPAILRTGRIDKMVYVPLPDAEARKEIFRLSLYGRYCDDDIDYALLAAKSEGYVASDIKYIVTESALDAARLGVPISQQHILEKLEVIFPSVSSDVVEQYERLRKEMQPQRACTAKSHIGYVA